MSLRARTRRKSPVKHKVSGHTRKGKKIEEYVRGKGKKKKVSRRSRVVVGSSLVEVPYRVSIFYARGPREEFFVDVKSLDQGLREGMSRRESVSPPSVVRIRRSR